MGLRVVFVFTLVLCTGLCYANDTFVDDTLTASTTIAAAEDEEEKMETFEELEGRMKNGMNSIIRRILPYIMKGASGTEVSGPCMSGLMRTIGGVRQLKEWALRIIDATGKIPPGILEGTSLSLGDYDECLDIRVGKKNNPPLTRAEEVFRGQYCLIGMQRPESLTRAVKDFEEGNKDAPIAKTKTVLSMLVRYKHLTTMTFKFGVCIPSTCTKKDLQNIFNSETLQVLGRLDVLYCEDGSSKAKTVDQYIILAIIGFVAGSLLLGTTIDVYSRIRARDIGAKIPPEKSGSLIELVRSFSLYSNALALMDKTNVKEPLRVLCALRTITVILTIYSHTYGHIHDLHFQKFSKPANFLKFFDSFTFSGIANGSVGMDTVVLIAGITITYTRWRHVSGKARVKLNVFSLLLQRYSRMTAAQLLVIGLFLLFPMIGSGPLWSAYVDGLVEDCRERWWLNVLYIGNFWSARVSCLYHTWILAVVMQLTLISVLIIWILRWSPKAGICLAGLLTLGGVIGVAVMTVIHDLPGSLAFFMLDVRTGPLTWRRVYTLLYDHLGPFCIGLLTGYFLAVKKDTLMLNRRVCALCWCISICCSSAVLFGLYQYRNGDKMGVSLSTFYAVTHRNVWALGIAWLIVACTTSNGGIVTKILRADMFVTLDRLCYLSFLIHIPIMYYHSGSIRERWFMGHFELLMSAIGYIVLSFLVSFVLYICFVRPFYYVESRICSMFGSKSKVTLQKKLSLPTTSFSANSASPSQQFDGGEGCINVGYSKTADGH